MEISQQINAAETLDDLNKLTEGIKNGNYSEADKSEIRKVFMQKKVSLLQKTNNEESHENV